MHSRGAKREPDHRRRGDHVQPADHCRIPALEEQPNEPLVALGGLVLVDHLGTLPGGGASVALDHELLADRRDRR